MQEKKREKQLTHIYNIPFTGRNVKQNRNILDRKKTLYYSEYTEFMEKTYSKL